MTLKDQRLDYLRKQLDDRGFVCERKMDSHSELHQFLISHDPEIELTFSRELLEMSSWLFTERADQAIGTATDARQNGRAGTLTMRFLDAVWEPNEDSL